jgi:hypothetical protein
LREGQRQHRRRQHDADRQDHTFQRAFTLLLPKRLQERLAENATLLPLVGVAAFFVTFCGVLTQLSAALATSS